MSLILQLVNETTLPDGGPVSFRLTGKRGIDIGRDTHLDWTLPDPTRYISSKHCEIRHKDGGYWLHDVSTNGTFLNGADHRMHAPHRLRTGDRFNVGHYIVAVTVEGEEAQAVAAPKAATAPPANYQELWASEGVVPPPISARELKPSRQNVPVNPDFLDWAADVPDLPYAAPSPAPAPRRVSQPPIGAQMDWAAGPPSVVPAPMSPPPAVPVPRRPGAGPGASALSESAFGESTSSSENTLSENTWGDAPAEPPEPAAVQPMRGAGQAYAAIPPSRPDAFVRALARAAGLPEEVLAQRDPDELAQQLGNTLRLVAENLIHLLSARRQAKQLTRSSRHTMIQATDNNPLKFSASATDALRSMFGPATESYLEAGRAIGQGFDDLKKHQLKTYTAMQHALTRLMEDLAPQTIEKDADEARGLGGLLASRKAKLWDAYQERWQAKFGRDSAGPSEVFMRYFSEFYDRDGG